MGTFYLGTLITPTLVPNGLKKLEKILYVLGTRLCDDQSKISIIHPSTQLFYS